MESGTGPGPGSVWPTLFWGQKEVSVGLTPEHTREGGLAPLLPAPSQGQQAPAAMPGQLSETLHACRPTPLLGRAPARCGKQTSHKGRPEVCVALVRQGSVFPLVLRMGLPGQQVCSLSTLMIPFVSLIVTESL